jgi:hypothetical protein
MDAGLVIALSRRLSDRLASLATLYLDPELARPVRFALVDARDLWCVQPRGETSLTSP